MADNKSTKNETLSHERVQKLGTLARLHVSPDESAQLTEKLNSILEYVRKLEAIDVTGVEPMSHVHGVQNVFRDDVLQPSMPNDEGLRNAPDRSGRFIRVPIIIE